MTAAFIWGVMTFNLPITSKFRVKLDALQPDLNWRQPVFAKRLDMSTRNSRRH